MGQPLESLSNAAAAAPTGLSPSRRPGSPTILSCVPVGSLLSILTLACGGSRDEEAAAAALAGPFAPRGLEVRVGASVGVAVHPQDGSDAEGLLRRADLALYAAKGAGRNTWRRYLPSMQQRADELAGLERELWRALGGALSSCTTSRSSPPTGWGCGASRPWSAGRTRRAASCSRARSCPRPKGRA
jgi:hypothetical protein